MERLEAGEAVKISSFGSFRLRDKPRRMGRNTPDARSGADRAAPGRDVPGIRRAEGEDRTKRCRAAVASDVQPSAGRDGGWVLQAERGSMTTKLRPRRLRECKGR